MTPHSNHRHVFVNGAAACLLAVCSVACCPTSLRGQENGLAESGFGALLLKETDAVISGRITRRGTHYEVEIASQSRVSIPLQNVAYAGTSLEDLYQFKRQGVSRWSVGDHYQLTRWCLRYGLLAQAAEHYGEVAQRQPDHVRVKQLRVELETRLLAEPAFRQYLGLAPVAPAPAARESLSPLDTPATEAVTASSRALDVLTHPEVVRRFSERVQPILINRCSQAACHGVQSSNSLRLLEPYAKSFGQITADNLNSVAEQISAQPGELSALVRYATRSHGIQRSPAIAVTETALLQELQEWIAFTQNPVVPAVVSEPPQSHPVRTAGPQNFVPFQAAVTLVPVQPGGSPLRQVPKQSSLPQPPPPSAGPTPPASLSVPSPGSVVPSTSSPSPSADPFDPAEFNRQTRP